MPEFRYWRCCIELPGEIVQFIADGDRAVQITYDTFARHANLRPLRQGEHPATYRMSCKDNWSISFWRSELPSGRRIYYFDWSRIEHVFVGDAVDLGHEMALLKEEGSMGRFQGKLVEVYKGHKIAVGTVGRCTWHGHTKFGWRVRLEFNDGNSRSSTFLNAANVRLLKGQPIQQSVFGT